MPRQLNTNEAIKKYCEANGLSERLGHVQSLRGKFYITAAGLRVLAQAQGIIESICSFEVCEPAKNLYIVNCAVVMPPRKAGEGVRTFVQSGSSSGSGVGGKGGKDGHALLGHAQTRAEARALRSALDVPLPVFEESGEYARNTRIADQQQQRSPQQQRQASPPPPKKEARPAWVPSSDLVIDFKPTKISNPTDLCNSAQVKKYQTTCKYSEFAKHFMLEHMADATTSKALSRQQIHYIIEALEKGNVRDAWVQENFVPAGHEGFPLAMEYMKKRGLVLEFLEWGKLQERHDKAEA